ncbi:hypothetical protein [Micromonospora qiuiae]|uniref:hypothetical protein n=1 Tax=Micromonospora qiuiae TaxID=502268 RepID=UPI00194DBC63|nr:hypothetical protein [Micromonospora qiuiae]
MSKSEQQYVVLWTVGTPEVASRHEPVDDRRLAVMVVSRALGHRCIDETEPINCAAAMPHRHGSILWLASLGPTRPIA